MVSLKRIADKRVSTVETTQVIPGVAQGKETKGRHLQRLVLQESNSLACNSGIYLMPVKGVSLLEVVG